MASYKQAFVDYWTLVKNFRRGDVVLMYNAFTGVLESIPGLVTAVHPGIGFLDVEYPWGNERVSPEYLVKQNPASLYNLPSFIDTSYSSWDIDQSRIEDGTAKKDEYSYARPKAAATNTIDKLAASYDDAQKTLRLAAAYCLHKGLNEIDAYRALTATVGKSYSDDRIQAELRRAYRPNERMALYWSAPGRKYRMNKGEIADGLPNCPKCDTNMQKTHYAKHTRLFVCPVCLFCIRPEDIEGLPQDIATTGFGVEAAAKTAKWDSVKNQAIKYVNRHYPSYRQYADEVAGYIVQEFADRMNIHEDVLPVSALKPRVESLLTSFVKDGLRARVRKVIDREKVPHADDLEDDIMIYLNGVPDDEILQLDEKEILRLVQLPYQPRFSNLRRFTASNSPLPLKVRQALGRAGLQKIFDLVRKGSKATTVASQFQTDFEQYGLGDAMFLLGASAADGLFEREAYNSLVDILHTVRQTKGIT